VDSRLVPAILAVFGGALVAAVLFLPFVVVSYRRHGEVGFGRTLLAGGFVVYVLAIATYTLLPLPQLDAAWCARHLALRHPQANPFQFVTDIRTNQRTPGLAALLANPAFQQVVFNIALFVPLGAYLRQVFRHGVLATVVIGFGVSLLVECTQLTGNWFLAPCPYRLFDVDDLIANTAGAALGVLAAPALRPLSGRRRPVPAGHPRPVTTGRRLLGMLLDLVSVYLLGGFLTAVYSGVAAYALHVDVERQPWHAAVIAVLGAWLPAVVLLVLPALGADGATAGQHAVRLRRVRPDGTPPGARVLVAALTGCGGYFLLDGLGEVGLATGTLTTLLLTASAVLAWRPRSHRGLSGWVAGLLVVDAREPAHRPAAGPDRDPVPASGQRAPSPVDLGSRRAGEPG
jgi:glycopeptide antibiotics resistance protein